MRLDGAVAEHGGSSKFEIILSFSTVLRNSYTASGQGGDG